MRRSLYITMAVLGLAGSMIGAAPAMAVQTSQPKLVSAKPVDWTPAVNDGAVRAIAQVGNTIVLGGTFTSVTPAGSTTAVTRNNILAFDATTGALSTTFAPVIDGPVDALVASADGQSVYVGGEFTNVNGVKSKSLARLRLSTGLAVTGYKIVGVNGNVLDLKLSGNRLFIGGNFSKFASLTQAAMGTVNATTGMYDSFMTVPFAGLHNGGTTAIQKFDITPDGSKMMVIGNFLTVGGVAHDQAAMIDLTGPTAAVANWGTTFYTARCANVFDSYMRDLDISPDGSYVVISTTGAYGGSASACDTTSRWEMGATGTGITPTWINTTGGDTTYAVAITGTAVYVGGHFRWSNNSFAGDRADAGAVAREGIAALDPKDGLPLDWDPGRARGVGVFDMLATPTGLWVGSDTDRIGGWTIHPRIAFFPLPTGQTVPPTDTPQLPAEAFLAGNTSATNTNVLYRVNAAGPALGSLDSGPDWVSDNGSTSPYHNTGSSVATYASGATTNASVPASTPNAIFDSERWDATGGNEMQWAFPVPTGTHLTVRLYFANRCTCTASVGQRRFNVSIDNISKLTNYDIVADAGNNVGTMKAFDITSDGSVNINFGHVTENPLVNGIEIINKDVVLTGTPNDVVTRHFDGTTAGPTTTLPATGISWAQARGAFYINGTVYAGWSDGNLYARSFDGTTFGAPVNVDGMDQLVRLAAFHSDVQNTTAMFFDSAQNRLYYVVSGTNQLYYRYFTPSTRVVGAVRYNATNTSTVNFANASAMFLSGTDLYVGDRATGNLNRVSFGTGVVSGTPVTVSGPGLDGTGWYGRAAFLRPTPGAPNVPPTAAFTSSCVAADCVFDATTSGDTDGFITSYTWTFGDGHTAASSQPAHTYASVGSYSVTLKVTDDVGAVNTVTHQVTLSAVAANIGFVGAASATVNNRNVSVTVPAAVADGNAMVLVATSANATTAITAPAGWTEVETRTATGIQTHIWQQVATGASAGSTVTVTQADTAKVSLILSAYSGTSATSPVSAHVTAAETVNRATHTTPTTTTSLTGAWLVSYWSDVSAATASWGLPAGQTQRATVSGSSTAHVSSVLSDLGGPLTTGTVGGLTATAGSSSAKAIMGTLVLAPEGAATPNDPPVASFTSPCSALACTFDGTGSSDSDGTVASYAWTFGDGGTDTTATPNHTYASPGTYSVTLTVTDNLGAVGTLSRQLTVTAVASNVAFVGSAGQTANATKVSVTVPANVAAGNALVLIATSANGTTPLTAPAGWTAVDQGSSSQIQTRVWQQVATAGSAGSSVQVTLGQQAKVSLIVAAYSGTNTTSPIVGHSVALETTNTAAHVTPTLATSSTGAWLLSYWSDVTTDTTGWTPPAGQASRASAIGTGGGHVSSILTDLGGPLTVGQVGGYTATATASSAKAVMTTLVLASS